MGEASARSRRQDEGARPEAGFRVRAAAVVPGLGHLLLGRWARGSNLLGWFLLMGTVVGIRWEAFLDGLSASGPGDPVASWFLVAALVGAVGFSVADVARLARGGTDQGPGKSPYRMMLRRFRANRLAVASVYLIAGLCLAGILAPVLAPYDPAAIGNVAETRYLPPSWAHPFGTDEFGRDLFSRALYGARVSLSIGSLAVLVATTVGTTYGAVSGYFGGWVDNVLMRIVDVIMAFPTFFLMLTLVGIFEADIAFLVLILGLTAWTGTARFIRGEILSLREQAFIEGARAIGLPDHRIILKHLIPNAMAPVMVKAALMVGGMVGAEAGLSFLGIGVSPPTPSWGNMISQGQDALLVAWWVAFFPGSLLALTILSFNLLADGLRDALDPKTLMRKYV